MFAVVRTVLQQAAYYNRLFYSATRTKDLCLPQFTKQLLKPAFTACKADVN